MWQALSFSDRPGLHLGKPVVLVVGCAVPHEYHAALKSIRHLVTTQSCTWYGYAFGNVRACFEHLAKRLPGRAWYVLEFQNGLSERSSLFEISASVKLMNASRHLPLSVTYIRADVTTQVSSHRLSTSDRITLRIGAAGGARVARRFDVRV